MLSGHSHSYERSYMIDGYYGSSKEFQDCHIRGYKGSGNPTIDSEGAYLKPLGVTPHNGTVYTVIGSSGKVDHGYSWDHPAHVISKPVMGSVILEFSEDGNSMDAIMLTTSAEDPVLDRFRISKRANVMSNKISGECSQNIKRKKTAAAAAPRPLCKCKVSWTAPNYGGTCDQTQAGCTRDCSGTGIGHWCMVQDMDCRDLMDDDGRAYCDECTEPSSWIGYDGEVCGFVSWT